MKPRIRKRLLIAPHLDDGAISFGGTLLADKERSTDQIETLVATVFSRSNYTREGLGDAGTITPIRQDEEKRVMNSIDADTLFLDFPECPLRGYTISDPLDYPKLINPELDVGVVDQIADCLSKLFKDCDEVLIPLAIGELAHVDHRIVRQAATLAHKDNPDVIFKLYEDVPYIIPEDRLRVSSFDGFQLEETIIDLEAKLRLIRGYYSQPIEAWEDFIRQAADCPPVERMWLAINADLLVLDL